MKYVPSALLGQLSRSAGSTTASRNRFGSYLRTRVQPVNPDTDPQSTVRAAFGGWSQAYRALTQAQRDGWAALGLQQERVDSLGQTYTLTGLQSYVSANQNLELIGGAALTAAPLLSEPPDPTNLVLTADTDPAQVLSLAYTAGSSGDYLTVELSAGVSAGKNFVPRSGYKRIQSVEISTASPLNVLAAWTAIYGAVVQGSKIFGRARVVREANGQASHWVTFDTIAL